MSASAVGAAAVLTLYLVSLCAVVYSVFCRLVKTDQTTLRSVRATFWLLGAVAAYSLFATMFWGHRPQLEDALLAAAIASTQAMSSKLWRFGVPRSYSELPPKEG